MQAFIDFLVNNYLWFLVISLILVFALIGYLVDTNEKKDKEFVLKNKEDDVDIPIEKEPSLTELLDEMKNS